jgi:arsenate reductase
MSDITLYHNPRCSKSRAALELLRNHGVEPALVLYLETPPDRQALGDIKRALGIPARQMLRTGEPEYAQLNLDDHNLDDEQLLDAIAEHPRLLERPVAVSQGRAVIGRPPERVLELL